MIINAGHRTQRSFEVWAKKEGVMQWLRICEPVFPLHQWLDGCDRHAPSFMRSVLQLSYCRAQFIDMECAGFIDPGHEKISELVLWQKNDHFAV